MRADDTPGSSTLVRLRSPLVHIVALTLVAPMVIQGAPAAPSAAEQPRKKATTASARQARTTGKAGVSGRSAARSPQSAGRVARPQASRPAASTPVGVTTSAYTGSYYRAAYEGFRRCIVHRESRGDYGIRNPRSGAAGAYQFLVSTSNEVARRMGRPDLIGRPASTWARVDQDHAFYLLYDHGRGASHWGYTCH